MARKVQLAVVAHIRHQYTDYDKLLKITSWGDARRQVEQPCLDQIVKWRGEGEEEVSELEDIFREVIVLDDDDDDEEEEEEEDEDEQAGITSSGEVDGRESSVEVISCRLITDTDEKATGTTCDPTDPAHGYYFAEPAAMEPSRPPKRRPARFQSPGVRQTRLLRYQAEVRRRYDVSLQAHQTASGLSVYKSIEQPADAFSAQQSNLRTDVRKRKPSPESDDRGIMLPQESSKRMRLSPAQGNLGSIDLTMTPRDANGPDRTIGADLYNDVGRNMYQYPKLNMAMHHVQEYISPSASHVYVERAQQQQIPPVQIRETMRDGIPVEYATLSRSKLISEGQILPTSRTWQRLNELQGLPVHHYHTENRMLRVKNNHCDEDYYIRGMPGSFPVDDDAYLRRTHNQREYVRAPASETVPTQSLQPRVDGIERHLAQGPASAFSRPNSYTADAYDRIEAIDRDVDVYELPVRASTKYY